MRLLRTSRALLLFLGLSLWLAGCGSRTEERLTALENQMIGQQVLDLRVSQLEERVTLVEEDLGAMRYTVPSKSSQKSGQSASSRPKPQADGNTPRKIDPNAPAAPLPGKPAYVPKVRPENVQTPPAESATGSTASPVPRPEGVRAPTTMEGPDTPNSPQPATPPAPPAQVRPAAPVSTPPAPALQPTGSEKSDYESALNAYNRKNFKTAAKGFSDFLQKHPQGALAPNARYWLGECHYSLKEYDEAIIAFKDVAGKYPTHNKAAASLLKLGYSYANMGDSQNARFYLQLLLDDFPGSEPAKLGRQKLQSLK